MSTMPAVFVSHGAPTMALEPGATHDFLAGLGEELGIPRAVLCASAHWESRRPLLSGASRPATVHDFRGFPRELHALRYAAPGDPALAAEAEGLLRDAGIEAGSDPERGFDHGAWVPLRLMYPDAAVPVVELSVQPLLDAAHHLAVGRALRPLRDRGVLILGSGGATHDLREFGAYPLEASPAGYAREFDDWLRRAIAEGDERALLGWRERAPHAERNHPTPEHLLPLFVPMGAATSGGRGRRIHAAFEYGILSMAAFAWD